MKKLLLFIVTSVPFVAMATPESLVAANIVELRPYIDGSVYVQLDSNVLCDTSVFLIDGGLAGSGKAVMYSAALAAFMGGKKIRVEALTSTGCSGWGTKLQSLYLLHN